ncbi:acetamidase/formamidase family protein [Pigmentiphaga soli]|uniref:Acetamidase/formamidase family protein n=1 Tax=Pigmentiphaga soli TaxID=1007095 RepID=A0ABP8H5T0_9BURK
MNRWQFDSDAYARRDRSSAWNEILSGIGLRSLVPRQDGFWARMNAIASGSGALFVEMRCASLCMQASPSGHEGHLWLGLLIDGEMDLLSGAARQRLEGGTLFYDAAAAPVAQADAPTRQCWVRLPKSAWRGALPSASPLGAGLLPPSPATPVLAGMLASLASQLPQLQPEHLRPFETAVIELMGAALYDDAAGGTSPSATRTAVLNRICQAIEARLDDPTLSQAAIVEEQGLSSRYLQKLFESTGHSFTQYLRKRRLERCRADLSNPLLSALSISQVCFRWGFNDAPHFSRAFREEYGMTPREFRRSSQLINEVAGRHRLLRGAPAQAVPAVAQLHDGGAAAAVLEPPGPPAGPGALPPPRGGRAMPTHHHLPACDATVHWGFVSRFLQPALKAKPGDTVHIETLTHHANDDHDRMVRGDAGAESVFYWGPEGKKVDRRGAGPQDASIYGRGAGEGFGVHVCTGPIHVEGAEPGDVLEVRILEVTPRPSANPAFAGRAFGSNAAAWWGFHYDDLLNEPRKREVITIFEIDDRADAHVARALYSYRWTPQVDPFGVVHPTIDYPGLRVDHGTVEKNRQVLSGVEIPVRLHFGFIGVAPDSSAVVDSIPPGPFGGNLDNWRVGQGASIYLPVSVPGALLSLGDPHASQGDAEIAGTAIECSLNGTIQLILHKKGEAAGVVRDLDYPLIETADEWVVQGFSHPNYLVSLGERAQSEIYKKSSLDLAMRDAFRKTRRFLMQSRGMSEDEAIAFISVAVDFGVTQVVDGNWGVHAIIRRSMFRD